MILFLEDWQKYPTAIVDTKTTNKSFVRLAGLYKSMGVVNHSFILALHDPELQGVDPYDPNLSQEMIGRIVVECKINPWYFFREIARAPSASGINPVRFKANRGNIALFWLFFNHITSMLIQPRQTGKSFSTGILYRYLLSIACNNTKMNLLTKDNKLRVSTIEVIKSIEKELPFYLFLTGKKDTNNSEEITVNALGNKLSSHLAQISPKAARNIGRGLTSPIFHIDEIAYLYNIEITLPAALASGGAARDIAANSGSPYGTVYTTTAGRLDTDSGRYAHKLLQNSAPWTEKFFDAANENVLVDMVRMNSATGNKTVILEFNHRQLGYTDEWLRGKMEDAESDGIDAETDFLNIWASGTDTSPISKDLLKILKESLVPDYYSDISNHGYITRWYVTEEKLKHIKENVHVVLSLDTSDAVGKDDIALTVRDIRTGKVLAVGNFNETNLITFSEWLVTWFTDFKKIFCIIERRSSGVAIIDYLLKLLPTAGINPFKVLFNWVVEEKEDYPDRFKNIEDPRRGFDQSVLAKYRKYFGFATSGGGKTSRDGLYGSTLLSAVKYTGAGVRDKMLINQLSGLTTRNGRIDHAVGGKDDLCISWMLSYWWLINGKNTQFYGIDPRIILSSVVSTAITTSNGKTISVEKKQEQEEIKLMIDKLMDFLKIEVNDLKAVLINNKIKQLSKELDPSVLQSFNISGMLQEINDNRRFKRKMTR